MNFLSWSTTLSTPFNAIEFSVGHYFPGHSTVFNVWQWVDESGVFQVLPPCNVPPDAAEQPDYESNDEPGLHEWKELPFGKFVDGVIARLEHKYGPCQKQQHEELEEI